MWGEGLDSPLPAPRARSQAAVGSTQVGLGESDDNLETSRGVGYGGPQVSRNISNTRRCVSSSDIQTLRSSLKIRGAAENFFFFFLPKI